MSAPAQVDAHQHFWRLARGDYGWLTADLAPLYRDFEPADLAPLLRGAGVGHSVAVQAAPTLAETRFLLGLADATPWIAGVVGWVDLEAPGAARALAEIARHPKLVGVRPMIQDLPDPAWMLRDALTPAFEALIDLDLCFDALVRPEHLPHLEKLLARHPRLRTVVDHGAKPAIGAGGFDAWAPAIARIAAASDACCKLSGLATEAGPGWTADALRPYVDHLLDAFGPQRLLWGSDWPVLNLAGDYPGWRAATRALLAGASDAERAAVLGGNAIRCYRLAVATEEPR